MSGYQFTTFGPRSPHYDVLVAAELLATERCNNARDRLIAKRVALIGCLGALIGAALVVLQVMQ